MDARVLLERTLPLNLYRRHSRSPGKCLGGHPLDSRSYEAEERRRRWCKCACAIYADGTLAGRFKRRNTGETDWDATQDDFEQSADDREEALRIRHEQQHKALAPKPPEHRDLEVEAEPRHQWLKDEPEEDDRPSFEY